MALQRFKIVPEDFGENTSLKICPNSSSVHNVPANESNERPRRVASTSKRTMVLYLDNDSRLRSSSVEMNLEARILRVVDSKCLMGWGIDATESLADM